MSKKQGKGKSSKKRSMRDRYKDDYKSRDDGGFSGSNILDLSKAKDVEFFKMEKGSNEIDIIPFEVATNKHPQGVEKGELDYKLDVWVHRDAGGIDGRILCLKRTFSKKCPICEEIQKMVDSDEYTWKDDAIKALKPSRRCIYNVIDINDEDKGIQLFEISHFEFQKEIIEEAQESAEGEGEILPFADLEDGYTIKFRAKEREGGFQGFKPKSFQFRPREAYPDEVIDDALSLDELLVIPSYDEVYNAFMGIEDEEPDADDDEIDDDEIDEDDEPKKTKKTRTRTSKKTETPARSRRKKADDDEDDDEPKKSSKKTSKKKKHECPASGTFGEDNDDYDECEDCDIWDECAEASDN